MRNVFMQSSITVNTADAAGTLIVSALPLLKEVIQYPDLVGVIGVEFESAIDAALEVRSIAFKSVNGNRFYYEPLQKVSDDSSILLTTMAPKIKENHAGMLMSLHKLNPEIGLQLEIEVGVIPSANWTSKIIWTLDNGRFGDGQNELAALGGTGSVDGNNPQGVTFVGSQARLNANSQGIAAHNQVGNPPFVSDERLKKNVRSL